MGKKRGLPCGPRVAATGAASPWSMTSSASKQLANCAGRRAYAVRTVTLRRWSITNFVKVQLDRVSSQESIIHAHSRTRRTAHHRTLFLLFLTVGGCRQQEPSPIADGTARLASSVPAKYKPPGEGWYCYEGATLRDSATDCSRLLENCRRNRASEGIAGEPPSPKLTECSRRDTAVCGAAKTWHERPTEPFAHCHTTLDDCKVKESSLMVQPAVEIVQACSTWR